MDGWDQSNQHHSAGHARTEVRRYDHAWLLVASVATAITITVMVIDSLYPGMLLPFPVLLVVVAVDCLSWCGWLNSRTEIRIARRVDRILALLEHGRLIEKRAERYLDQVERDGAHVVPMRSARS